MSSALSRSFSIFSSRNASSISPVRLGHRRAMRKKHLHRWPSPPLLLLPLPLALLPNWTDGEIEADEEEAEPEESEGVLPPGRPEGMAAEPIVRERGICRGMTCQSTRAGRCRKIATHRRPVSLLAPVPMASQLEQNRSPRRVGLAVALVDSNAAVSALDAPPSARFLVGVAVV